MAAIQLIYGSDPPGSKAIVSVQAD